MNRSAPTLARPMGTMPDYYDVENKLAVNSWPFEDMKRVRAVFGKAMLSVWEPRWKRLVADLAATAGAVKTGDEAAALRYLRLHAQRVRLFPGMQEWGRIGFFDEHHDWMALARNVLDAKIDARWKQQGEREREERRKGWATEMPDVPIFPTLQDIDPFTSEYLPAKGTGMPAGIVVMQGGVMEPYQRTSLVGPSRLGLVETYKSGRTYKQRLSILVSSWYKPVTVDPVYGSVSDVAASHLRGWLSVRGLATGVGPDRVRESRDDCLAPAFIRYTEQGRSHNAGMLLESVPVKGKAR